MTCVVSAALFPFSGCSSADPKDAVADRDARDREVLANEVADELAVGRQIAAKLLGRFGRYDKSAAAERYVNLVGHLLASQSGRPELEFRFAILDDDEANAFATPGGYIFITRELLAQIRSEDELAGVLGHEIAHVNEKHMYKEIAPKKDLSATETAARLLSRGRGDLGGSISKIVNAGLELLLEKGLGTEKELAADQAGSMYAQVAGYDPRALLGLVRRLGKGTVKLGKTHPPFPERITSLDTFLKQNGLTLASGKRDMAVTRARFHQALDGLPPSSAKVATASAAPGGDGAPASQPAEAKPGEEVQ
jgi:predicted Zn-dependent protease